MRLCIFLLFASGSVFARFCEHPLRNSVTDPVWLAGAGALCCFLVLDDDVEREFSHQLLPGPVARAADFYGKGLNYALAAAFAGMKDFRCKGSEKDRWQGFKRLSEAYAATLVATAGLKYTVRRTRPNGENRTSFPSGHTSGSFAIAMVLQELYGNPAGIPAFILAGLTGMQRLHARKHWLTDVLAGALLGSMIGKGFAETRCDGNRNFVISYSIVF